MVRPSLGGTLGPFFRDPPPADAELAAFWRQLDRHVPANRLTQADRNAIWRHLKATAPEQVAFFKDPTVKQLLAAGAVMAFPPELIEAARRAATQVT